jgi:hypothetical protein
MFRILCAVAVAASMLCGGEALAATYQITPSEDIWVYSFLPDNNYRNDTGIATDMHNMSPAGYAFLKFSIPTLGSGEVIQSAALKLYQWTGAGYGEGPTAIGLFSNNNWSENTLTWNNTPNNFSGHLATNSNGHSYVGWSSWDFPWNPSFGSIITLYVAENSSGDQSHWWYSKEYSNASLRPYLEITTGIRGHVDFNADGKPDLLWRNTSTGQNAVWYMNGVTMISGALLPTLGDLDWSIVGVDDFNADGKPDLVWRNTATGQNAVWYMNGEAMISGALLPALGDQTWAIVGTGDFNADNKPDILWRNTETGQNAVWYMSGVTFAGGALLPALGDQSWQIAGSTATRCPNIAGTWNFTQTGNLTVSIAGQTITEPISESGSGTVTQNGCNVTWTDPTNGVTMSGTITGHTIHGSGTLLGSDPEFTITQDTLSWSGTVSTDRRTVTVNGTGYASGFYQGWFFSCNGNETMTFTRTP